MELWDKIERRLTGLLGACALAIGAYQIFGRYVDPHLAITWGEETTVYLVVWAVFLASSQLVRTDGHVRPDLVLRILKPRQQRIVEIGNCLVAIAFCAGLTWFGWRIASGSYDLDERSSTGLSFPMWIYYSSLLAGALLMTMRYVIRLYRYVFQFDPATMTIGGVHETVGE
jgi:TRAP-type C4-dicarboxylate transport system permease small subunit